MTMQVGHVGLRVGLYTGRMWAYMWVLHGLYRACMQGLCGELHQRMPGCGSGVRLVDTLARALAWPASVPVLCL